MELNKLGSTLLQCDCIIIYNTMKVEVDKTVRAFLFESRNPERLNEFLIDNPEINLIELEDKDKNTIIHERAFENNLDIIKIYIKYAKNYLERRKKTENQKMGLYSRVQKQEITSWLNRQNTQGFTPLLYAAYNGHIEVIKYLQEEYDASSTLTTNTGLNILHLAAQSNKVLPFIYFRNKIPLQSLDNTKSTPLHWAAFSNSQQAVAYILSEGTNVMNLKDNEGQTPLMLAVTYGNTRVVRRLLIKGANRYIKNNENKTPREVAIESEYKTISKMLNQEYSILDFVKFYCNVKIEYRPKNRSYTMPLIFSITLAVVLTILNFVINFKWEYSYHVEGIFFGLLFAFYCSLLVRSKDYERKPIDQFLDDKIIKKVCFDCQIIRPKRGYHCDICHSCIPQYDHHCTWINNCVGKNNLGRFLTFLFFIVIGLGFIGLISVVVIIGVIFDSRQFYSQWFEFRYTVQDRSLSFYLTMVLLSLNLLVSLFVFPVFTLFTIQVKNLLSNKTTYERIRGPQQEYSPNKQKMSKRKHNVSLGNCKVMCAQTHQSFVTANSSDLNEELISSKFPSQRQ